MSTITAPVRKKMFSPVSVLTPFKGIWYRVSWIGIHFTHYPAGWPASQRPGSPDSGRPSGWPLGETGYLAWPALKVSSAM